MNIRGEVFEELSKLFLILPNGNTLM